MTEHLLFALCTLCTVASVGACARPVATNAVLPSPRTSFAHAKPPLSAGPPPAAAKALAGSNETPSQQASQVWVSPTLIFEDPYPADSPPKSLTVEDSEAQARSLAHWNRAPNEAPTSSPRNRFHPGTRVVVEAQVLRKRVLPKSSKRKSVMPEQSLIGDARARGYWPFRRCYEEHSQDNTDKGGETKIRITINSSGSVLATRLIKTEFSSNEISKCLAREAKQLHFSPRPPRRIDVDLTVGVWPGDLPLAAPGTPLPTVTQLPEFDSGATLNATEPVKPAIEACFVEAQRRSPDLWGRLSLRIVLEVDGTIHVMQEHDSYFPDANVVRCVEQALAKVVFPSVAGRPFTFVLAMRFGEPPIEGSPPIAVPSEANLTD